MLQTISPVWAGIENTKKFAISRNNSISSVSPRSFQNTPTFFLNSKKALSLMGKRLWFFDTAAPIPGVSS
jgi:hypothetical protein